MQVKLWSRAEMIILELVILCTWRWIGNAPRFKFNLCQNCSNQPSGYPYDLELYKLTVVVWLGPQQARVVLERVDGGGGGDGDDYGGGGRVGWGERVGGTAGRRLDVQGLKRRMVKIAEQVKRDTVLFAMLILEVLIRQSKSSNIRLFGFCLDKLYVWVL